MPRRWLEVAILASLVVPVLASDIETPDCESGFSWATLSILIMAMIWWCKQASRKHTASVATQTSFSAVHFGNQSKDVLQALCRERGIVPARLKRDIMEQLFMDEAQFVRL